ncbi:MAG: RecB family exonuclease [Thermoanaerobaculia bacterium]
METETAVVAPPERHVFSYSAISDYLKCPRSYFFGRVMGLEPEDTSWAALVGIAYHHAIAGWHTLARRDPVDVILRDFEQKLREEIATAQGRGLTIDGYDGEHSILEELPDAHEILTAYLADPRNAVALVVNECRFEVEIRGSGKTAYCFKGYVDQIREHPDGTWHLVDLKTGATRPTDLLLSLDFQLSLYALAMVKGKFFPRDRGLPPIVFGRRPDSLSLAMLRDYGQYKKNQFAETIKGENKVKNPATGRMILEELPNPAFTTGYKKGDPKGPVFYRTLRSDFDLRQAEIDLSRVCASIRLKQFYRRPAAQGSCVMCRFTKECLEERAEPL